MKKIYLAAIAVLLTIPFIAQAQWTAGSSGNYYLNSGNAGLGTTTPISGGSAASWLTVNGSSTYSGGVAYAIGGDVKGFSYIAPDGLLTQQSLYTGQKFVVNTSTTAMTILPGGNVGIGATSPLAQLQVGTSTSNTGSYISMIGGAVGGGAVNALSLVNSATAATGNEVNMTFHTAGNYSPTAKISAIAESVQPVTDLAFSTYNNVTGITEQMRILGNGYVGIGTSTPHEALSVNGTIRSKEVKVETVNWPDYVFKPDYKLPSLTSVKAYIDKNQHLPDMPSEPDVVKDGVNLGEMNRSLLKKVEELTLYLIKEHHKNEEQAHLINKLQMQFDSIKEKVKNK